MRTTLNINDDLMARVRELTGINGKTKLVHMGLQALIERESSKRLATLGASAPDLSIAPRRHSGYRVAEDCDS